MHLENILYEKIYHTDKPRARMLSLRDQESSDLATTTLLLRYNPQEFDLLLSSCLPPVVLQHSTENLKATTATLTKPNSFERRRHILISYKLCYSSAVYKN